MDSRSTCNEDGGNGVQWQCLARTGFLSCLILGLGLLLAGGCSVYRLAVGEHFAYAFTNAGDEEIEDVRAEVPGYGRVYGQAGMSGHSKAFHLINVWAEEGRRVPEVVEVRWRKLPEPGERAYTGEPVGPYPVKVRERIPPEVLTQVRSSRDLQLRLIFAIQNQGVDFRWEVHDYGWEGRGTKILRSGE